MNKDKPMNNIWIIGSFLLLLSVVGYAVSFVVKLIKLFTNDQETYQYVDEEEYYDK